MFQDCKLVHGDLSEYNMLYHDGALYFIDVSQVSIALMVVMVSSSSCCCSSSCADEELGDNMVRESIMENDFIMMYMSPWQVCSMNDSGHDGGDDGSRWNMTILLHWIS